MKNTIDHLHRDILLNLEPAPANAIGAQVAERMGVRAPDLAAQLVMTLESIAEDTGLAEADRQYARKRLDSIPI